MKKTLDTTSVVNELRGQSVFFPTQQKEAEQDVVTPTNPIQQREVIQPLKQELEAESYHDTVIPRHHDTTVSRYHPTALTELDQGEAIFEQVRKAVKQIGKEAATHRFTLEEKNLLSDIEYTYKRHGIRTSENEVTRIAINYIAEDYKKNGETSILANILKKLNE